MNNTNRFPPSEDGTKIYLPSGQQYTLGEFLAQVNPETKISDDDQNSVTG
ncbi:MAG: hypothetical protein Q4E74_10635 [Ruminococcus sp.]|nr:hypothetical protein [Ruminococcus sp.]